MKTIITVIAALILLASCAKESNPNDGAIIGNPTLQQLNFLEYVVINAHTTTINKDSVLIAGEIVGNEKSANKTVLVKVHIQGVTAQEYFLTVRVLPYSMRVSSEIVIPSSVEVKNISIADFSLVD